MANPLAITLNIADKSNNSIVVRANIVDVNNFPAISPVSWNSTSGGVASVQAIVDQPNAALILAQNAGTTTVTATSNGQSATFAVTVINTAPGATTAIDVSADSSFQPTKKMQ